MNKNIVKLFAIVMMIFMIGAALVACGGGQKGEKGDQGLQGAPGVQGEQGEQGVAGLTPYIGENGNWWIGDEDLGVCPEGKPALRCENHLWDEVYITIAEHSQNTIGLYLKVCVECDGAEILRVNHSYDQKVEVVAPTCTEEGYTVWACSCGLTENRDFTDPAGHKAGVKEYVKNEAGVCACVWDNAWFVNCSECGVELEKGKDGATGHTFTNYEPMKPDGNIPLCEWREGSTRAVCDVCGCHEDYKWGEKERGHKEQEYTDWKVDGDKLTLSYVCDDCGTTVTNEVSIANDCVTDEKAATCTAPGYKTVVYNYTVAGAKKTIVLVDEKYDIVPHTEVKVEGYLPTCDDAGLSDGKKCSVCGTITEAQKEIAKVGHNHGEGIDGATRPNIVIEIDSIKYDAYWCEVCVHWIAYQKHEG